MVSLDINVYMFIMIGAITLCVIRLLRPEVSQYERVFLILIIVALAYSLYDERTQYGSAITQTKAQVNSVLNVVKKSLDEQGIHGLHFTTPIQRVLESDPVLLKAVLALMKYSDYDKDSVFSVIETLVRFYELYADILLDVKAAHRHIRKLIDTRHDILTKVHTMFVAMPNTKHTKVFEYISLILQSSTYKCLNVLKNKYGTTDHEPPLAENMYGGSSFEMF